MVSFTKKEGIIILIVILIIIISLGFKFSTKDKINSNNMLIELDNEEESNENQLEFSVDNEEETDLEIMVHISGQVYKPGIIILESGKRLVDAVELAGGLKSNADLDKINLAKKLLDEEKIYIPEIGENLDPAIEEISTESTLVQSRESGKININTCTKEELISLPGIGEVIAGRIIDYRTGNPFKNVEEIKSVSGIGDKKFEGIKELIIVN